MAATRAAIQRRRVCAAKEVLTLADTSALDGRVKPGHDGKMQMICPHCGAELQQRNRVRLVITGSGFIVAAFALLWLLHLPVVVLACVVLTVIGAYFVNWGVRFNGLWCRKCGRVPKPR